MTATRLDFSSGTNLSSTRAITCVAALAAIQLVWHTASGVPLTGESAALSLIGGILGTAILSVLFRSLPLRRLAQFVLVWPALFAVQVFADLIEGSFFTTTISTLPVFVDDALLGAGVTFLESFVGLLFRPAQGPSSLSSMLASRRLKSLLIRLVVASLAYLPIYFFFGGLVSPFVLPYYNNSSLDLVIPSFSVIIPVELLRGFLFAATLVPIILSVRLSQRSTLFLVCLFLYVVGAFIPFVGGTSLPWTLRSFHSIEIFGDSLTYAGVLTLLFKGRTKAT